MIDEMCALASNFTVIERLFSCTKTLDEISLRYVV